MSAAHEVIGAIVDAAAEAMEKVQAEAEPDQPVKMARWADLQPEDQHVLGSALHPFLAPIAVILELRGNGATD